MKSYRLKRSYLWLSVFGLPFCLVGLVGSITFGVDDAPPPNRWILTAMYTIIWGGLGCVNAWMLLECVWHRLELDGPVVREVGVFTRCELSLAEIIEAQWNDAPSGGRLRLKSAARKLAIQFTHYEPADRQEIIRHFHSSLPTDVQRGWDRFCYVVLIGVNPNREPRPGRDIVVRLRRRVDWYCGIGALLALLPVSVVAWRMTGDARSLGSVPLFLAFWIAFRWFLPVKEIVDRSPQLTSPALQKLQRLLMACCVAGLILPFALRAADSHVAYIAIAAIAGMFVWLCVFQRLVNRIDRERRRLSEPIERAAAAEWERTEAALAQCGAAGESP